MGRPRPVLVCAALVLGALLGVPDAGAQDPVVLSAKLSADPANFRGPCGTGVRVTLTGTVVTSGPISGIKAQFRFGDGTLGRVLAAAPTSAGMYVVRDSFVRSASWRETVVLRVVAPTGVESAPITVTGACDAVAHRPPVAARPAPEPAPGTATHEARFRVTATGFRVVRQTIESVIETNGVGDEVKFVCFGGEYELGGAYTPLPTVRTLTYGDLDGSRDFSRVQAGRGNGRSRGGLMTGDEVPEAGAVVSRTSGEGRFPIVLWEGVLRDGPGGSNKLVLLLPTLWEMDNAPANDLMPEFGRWATAFLASYSFRTMTDSVEWGATTWGAISLIGNGMYSNRFQSQREGDFSRPIGINGPHAAGPLEVFQERRLQTDVYFVPRPFRLTFRNAWTAAHTIPTRPRSQRPARGAIEVQFNEPEAWGGQYDLLLRIEVVPP